MKIPAPIFICVILLAGCSAGGSAQDAAAAGYCTQNGGKVETRYPYYDANSQTPLQLAGSLEVCTFTAGDDSRITISLDTLYTDQPTLAASAYLAKLPMEAAPPSSNPSSVYCSMLGGTDVFGGTSGPTGGWGTEGARDIFSLCIFPDLSVIDSWGLTYHSNDTIRGADLAPLLRYQPPDQPRRLFP